MPLPSGTNENSGPSPTLSRRSGRVTTNRFGATGGEDTGRSWNRNTAAATSASSADKLQATRSRRRLLFMRPAPTARPGSAGRSTEVDEPRVTASSISSRASPMSRSRRPLSFSRQRRTSRRIVSGAVAGNAAHSGWCSSTAASVSLTVLPSKALRPVSISKSTHPNAQMSVRLSID